MATINKQYSEGLSEDEIDNSEDNILLDHISSGASLSSAGKVFEEIL